MFRLLQGDVGSGKTIVALISCLNVVNSGYQVAFMAPTEILANQHYKLAQSLIKDKMKIGFLTSKTDYSERKKIINDLETITKNSIHFGDPKHPKTKSLLNGVVSGIGGYGNCIGVPTVAGETKFDETYNENILVNAMAVGHAKKNKIFSIALLGNKGGNAKKLSNLNVIVPSLNTARIQESHIFLGQSGVGKSSLINSLIPDLKLRVNEISNKSKLGKHTTTNTTLYHIPTGGDLIDSPGVREFQLENLTENEIRNGFKEFKALSDECRFRDCKHISEPNCRVKDALEKGEININRYHSYLNILT